MTKEWQHKAVDEYLFATCEVASTRRFFAYLLGSIFNPIDKLDIPFYDLHE